MPRVEQKQHTITVHFYEENAEQPFATSELSVDQLPDTFEVDTLLNIGAQEWRIVEALPTQKSQFRESGTLSLFLTQHTSTFVDPNQVLYSLPTINNALAAVEHTESFEDIFIVREDDWRQFECIEQDYDLQIEEELRAIQNTYEHHSTESGFTQIHLRQKIIEPLRTTRLTLHQLKESFEIVKTYKGVAFNTAAATVINGFALQMSSGWLLWGQSDPNGHIHVLNLAPTETAQVSPVAHYMDTFLAQYGLYLVDWSGLFWCGPHRSHFAEWGANHRS